MVVTGGARGIGAAIGRLFGDEGAAVVVLDLATPSDPLPGVRYATADVSSHESVREAFDEIGRTERRVDVLVNNAGIQRVGVTDELPVERWHAVIGTNLTGVYLCAARAIPFMRRQGAGAIVSIASTAAYVGLPGRGPYSAAKAGLLALTRVMAMELAPFGIRVNAVAPGFTRTELVGQGLRDGSLQESWMVERIPMGRLGRVDEIAGVVRFLASDDASYVTGQCVVADGGWTIQGIGAAPGWLKPTPTGSE